MADCFNDKRISSGVRRPRDTDQKGGASDLIRDTDDPLRKAHLIAVWTPNLTVGCQPSRLSLPELVSSTVLLSSTFVATHSMPPRGQNPS